VPGLTSDTYSKSLVSYIDVLGFENLVSETVKDPSKVATIASLLTTMQENLSARARVHRDSNEKVVKIFDSFNLSDLAVRSTRIPDGAIIGHFVDWELFYLAANQLALAINLFHPWDSHPCHQELSKIWPSVTCPRTFPGRIQGPIFPKRPLNQSAAMSSP